MRNETMSSRERWTAVLKRQKPDRIPMGYRATAEATDKLLKHLGCATFQEARTKLHLDPLVGVGPRYIGPALPPDGDEYGHRFADIQHGSGSYRECTFHPLAGYQSLEQLKREYRWPSIDWFDFSDTKRQLQGKEDQPITGGGSEPFLTYCYLRGQEQAMLDLVENPEIVEYCLGQLFELCYQKTARLLEQIPGKVLLSWVAEDMGSQEGLMFSPTTIRRFLLPGMKRMIDLLHSAGVFVFHHNDGAVRAIIPDMIKAGIDALDPIQWRCQGMEREGLKRDFGQSVIFHGGVDNQYTLPFGTVAEVRQEAQDNIRILGAGGGYIFGPCHNIQPVGPAENVVAMYQAGLEYGWCN